MAYLTKQTLEYSDGTSQVINYTEDPVEALSDFEPLMDDTNVAPEEVVEAPVETPAETVTTDSPSVETAPVVETPVEVAPEAPVDAVEAPVEAPIEEPVAPVEEVPAA